MNLLQDPCRCPSSPTLPPDMPPRRKKKEKKNPSDYVTLAAIPFCQRCLPVCHLSVCVRERERERGREREREAERERDKGRESGGERGRERER